MSATSMGSPVLRRLRLKARKLPDKSSYPVTEPFDPGSLSVAISSIGTRLTTSAAQQLVSSSRYRSGAWLGRPLASDRRRWLFVVLKTASLVGG